MSWEVKVADYSDYEEIAAYDEARRFGRDGLGEWCHWGATTQDITDSATIMQIREGLAIIEKDINDISDALAALAKKHGFASFVEFDGNGRMYVGDKVWTPPVDLRRQEPWIQFATYLSRMSLSSSVNRINVVSALERIDDEVLDAEEVAQFEKRVEGLLSMGRFPSPNRYERSMPWPPV